MPALRHPPSPQNRHGLRRLDPAVLHHVLAVCPDIFHVTPCFSSLIIAALSAPVGWDPVHLTNINWVPQPTTDHLAARGFQKVF